VAGEDTKVMIMEHFAETHKNLFKELDTKYMTAENKAFLAEQKKNLKEVISEFKDE
jgi:hypothetical protein